MLDAQFVRENLEAVKTNCRNRNVKADVDRVVQLDDERKRLVQETQTLQQRANAVAKLTGPVRSSVSIPSYHRSRENGTNSSAVLPLHWTICCSQRDAA